MPTLKAKVGGVWVPLSGSVDEVWVGPDDPGAAFELWYDTDDPLVLTPASQIGFAPVGTIAATDVQAAIAELDTSLPTNMYAMTMHHAALGANTLITASPGLALVTIVLPTLPVAGLLDISHTTYINTQVAGHGSGFLEMRRNGVNVGPVVVTYDQLELRTYSGRVVNVVQSANVATTITLHAITGAAGGTIQAQATNTVLSVVVYRPRSV
jgi:hypothetical protein